MAAAVLAVEECARLRMENKTLRAENATLLRHAQEGSGASTPDPPTVRYQPFYLAASQSEATEAVFVQQLLSTPLFMDACQPCSDDTPRQVALVPSSPKDTGKAVPPPPEISDGSMNHPHNCGLPCKFIQKSKGCKDGAQCTRCHLCKWTRVSHDGKRMKKDTHDLPLHFAAGPAKQVPEQTPELLQRPVHLTEALKALSLGSAGHAVGACGPPCKFFWRKRGCYEGQQCQCCHLCTWSRSSSGTCQPELGAYVPGARLLCSMYSGHGSAEMMPQ